jgi:hypothetical protein
MVIKAGDIVRHPDGSLGVVEDIIKTRSYERMHIRWIADCYPSSTPTSGVSYEDTDAGDIQPTGARVENYETL